MSNESTALAGLAIGNDRCASTKWEFKHEGRIGGAAVVVETSAMALRETFGNTQPQPGTFSDFFRREEWIHDLLDDFRRDWVAAIDNANFCRFVIIRHFDGNPLCGTSFDGVVRIVNEVHKNL